MPTSPKSTSRRTAVARAGSTAQRGTRMPRTSGEAEGLVRRPLQSRSEQSLAKMVAACRALAEERGNLDEISLGEVVAAAKTSIGAFYARFKDKEAMLAYVLDVALGEVEQVVLRSIAEHTVWQTGPAEAIVDQITHLYVSQYRENRGLFRAFLRHYTMRGLELNPLRNANRRIIGLVEPWLASQLRDRSREIAIFEVRAAIQFIVGTLSNVLLHDPGPLHLDDAAIEPHLNRMVSRYLGLPESRAPRGKHRPAR
ncbi:MULTISPECIES: TetR/AcrR family transcriptional regulator [Cupriavidus]|nr:MULTISPECIES: TetR/AcrR family transcriptional regulator [Cupriavidus]